MQVTRRRILEILKTEGRATVTELADALSMAPVSVRHHLDILQGQDLVASRVMRKRTVGRPEQVYLLTEAANEFFPSNFQGLAAETLSELKRLLPAEEVNAVFQRMAQRTAQEAPLPKNGQSAEEHLADVTSFLSERGYLALWEANGDGYLLHTCNCPYAGLAEEHPELCQMDMMLMSALFGGSPRCLGRLADGQARCSYAIKRPAAVAVSREELEALR